MKRRAQGEGSLFFDKSKGRWVGAAEVSPDPLTGNRRRVRVIGAAGEKQASVARRLKTRIAELDSGTEVGTVAQLVDSWLSRGAPKRKGLGALATARFLVDRHIIPAFGSVKVADLRAEDVERWMDAMGAAGFSKATIAKARSQLSQAFDYGIKRRRATWNPARIAEAPTGLAEPRQGRALTGPEARSLLNVADKERIGAWVTVALTLGLRPGEISGLTWPAVDLPAGKIVIHQSLAWVSDQPTLKEPKTKRSRTLDLPPRTVEALRRHRAAQIEERLLMGGRWPLRWEDRVFITTNGTPIGPTNLRRVISRMAVEAGIDGGFTPYDLRHTATSLLSASGVAPELLADLLGHRDTRMVFRHYRHPVTPTISTAANHIEEALAL